MSTPGFTLPPPMWTATHEPADQTQATISKAAVAGQLHHVCAICCTLEGAAQVIEVHFVLRDSTTGAGNILWQGKLTTNAAGVSRDLTLTGLNIPGVIGQAMTIETVAAPSVATTSATVWMAGYTEQTGP